MNQLAYIILNYNSVENTISLIESIRSFDSSNHIIVVDNNSTDSSADRLSGINERLNFKLLISEINGGYAKGNNLGLQYISDNLRVDFVFICNPDIILNKGNVEVLSNLLHENPDCSIAGLQMKDENGNLLTSAWKLPSIWHDLIISSSLLRRLFGNPLLYKSTGELQYVEVIQGAFFIARFSSFQEIGFFDSRTFLYAEERIVGLKMKALGYKLLFDSNHSFVHAVGASINEKFPTNRSKYRLIFRSRVIYHRIVKERGLSWRLYRMIGSLIFIEKLILDIFSKRKRR
jgi:GT2 family glycosyltransferase